MSEDKYFHRQSIRLDGYDYASAGDYFVTICIQDREKLLGEIDQGKMILNEAGKMVDIFWKKISEKFRGVDLELMGDNTVSPLQPHKIPNNYVGLGQYISWFKRMTTNRYIQNIKSQNWPRFDKKLWQRNYYEHIIRVEKEYWTTKKYIIDNPKNWEEDELN